MLRLAGFSPGTGVCARGGTAGVIRNWGAGDERVRRCGSVAACALPASGAFLAGRCTHARSLHGSGGAVALGAHSAMRFCAALRSVCGRGCVSVGAVCFGSHPEVHLCCSDCLGSHLALRFWREFALGSRPALRFWREFTLGSCPGLRFWRDVALVSRTVSRFCCRALPRFTPAVCRIAPNRTACDILRFYSAGSRSSFVRSRSVLRLSAFVSSLQVWAFLCGDPDGLPGTWRTENGATGSAARRLCVFAQPHWLCGVFRGEYVGGCAPPNLRQRVECGSRTAASLDSLHAAAGLCRRVFAAFVHHYAITLALLCFPLGVRWGCAPQTCAKESLTLWTLFRGWPSEKVRSMRCFALVRIRAPSPGYTERPARL